MLFPFLHRDHDFEERYRLRFRLKAGTLSAKGRQVLFTPYALLFPLTSSSKGGHAPPALPVHFTFLLKEVRMFHFIFIFSFFLNFSFFTMKKETKKS
jgi:hypothetical protein